EARESVRSVRHDVSPHRKHVRCVLEAIVQHPSEHEPDRVEPERELDDDSEVAAATTQSPEELRMLALACRDDTPVCCDDLRREQVVEREAVRRTEMADAAAERQSGDSRVAERPTGRR